MRRSSFVVCAGMLVVAFASAAQAQDRPEPAGNTDPQPMMDVGDLWHKVRNQQFTSSDD